MTQHQPFIFSAMVRVRGSAAAVSAVARIRGAKSPHISRSVSPDHNAELRKLCENLNVVFADDDPFVILPAKLKNFEKLGADLFFNLLVKIALYSFLV